MADADPVREVTPHVESAIRANRRIESILMVMVLALFFVGCFLMFFGAVSRQGLAALPGSLCELAIVMPIRSLGRTACGRVPRGERGRPPPPTTLRALR